MSNQTQGDAERRDQQVATSLTKEEKRQVKTVADDLGTSLSGAVRYLIKKGLAVHQSTHGGGE